MISITVHDGGIPQKLRRMARACQHPRAPLADLGGHMVARIKKSMPDRPPLQAAPAGKPPAVHSSEYVHSIFYDVPSAADRLRVGSSSKRARILQEGGEIRATRRKFLTIPIAVESYGKRVADFPGLELMAFFSRGGMRKMLWGRGGTPLFVYQPRVTIRPHPHFDVTRDDWKYFGRALRRQLDREVAV